MLTDPLKRYFSSFGVNHFEIDRPFRQGLKWAGLPQRYEGLLSQLGEYAGGELLELLDYIDKVSPPRLQMWDIDGRRFDWVRLNPAHRDALGRLMTLGVVHRTFTEGAPWQLHYAMGYLVADPGLFCTVTLTNQTAYALHKYADPRTRDKFLPNYVEGDGSKAWHGATFYTEIQGGSDLGANLAEAVSSGEAWRISSEDKYFASNAGIADGALVTARPRGRPSGPKGLALFFVPALREDGSANFTIRRLKEKMGTRAVPTGEAVLRDSEAYLLGSVEGGIYLAMEVLTLARLANVMGALGVARKAYLEALFYTRKRKAFGKPLMDHPLVRKDLLEMEVDLEANLALGLRAVRAFDEVWREKPPYSDDYHYARLLVHLAKNMTAEMSARVTRTVMELHGGIGFLEDFPIARWHREAMITPIWEGGSNTQALDMLETIAKKQSHHGLFAHIESVAASIADEQPRRAVLRRVARLREEIEKLPSLGPVDSQYYAKDLLCEIGECAAAAFLHELASEVREQTGEDRFLKVRDAYIRTRLVPDRLSMDELKNAEHIIHLGDAAGVGA
jgi:acyl-CoA dehydrogenase